MTHNYSLHFNVINAMIAYAIINTLDPVGWYLMFFRIVMWFGMFSFFMVIVILFVTIVNSFLTAIANAAKED